MDKHESISEYIMDNLELIAPVETEVIENCFDNITKYLISNIFETINDTCERQTLITNFILIASLSELFTKKKFDEIKMLYGVEFNYNYLKKSKKNIEIQSLNFALQIYDISQEYEEILAPGFTKFFIDFLCFVGNRVLLDDFSSMFANEKINVVH
ncbi:MAG: hypothetical protein R3Y64_10770 [Peptostreptococcaceae bacterium]